MSVIISAFVTSTDQIKLVGGIATRKVTEITQNPHSAPPIYPPSDFSQLFDILHALPSTLGRLDIVVRLASEQHLEEAKITAQSLIRSCRRLIAQLQDWRTRLDRHNAAADSIQLVWEEPSDLYHSLPADSPLRIFPTYFCFLNLDMAQQILLHMVGKVFLWTVMFAMEDMLERMAPPQETSISEHTPSDGDLNRHECRRTAIQVAQSLEYFVRPDMGLTAIDFFGFPVSFICDWMTERDVPEKLWFRVIFDRLRVINAGYAAFLETASKLHGDCDIFDLLQ
jgi:hypothetical protein